MDTFKIILILKYFTKTNSPNKNVLNAFFKDFAKYGDNVRMSSTLMLMKIAFCKSHCLGTRKIERFFTLHKMFIFYLVKFFILIVANRAAVIMANDII